RRQHDEAGKDRTQRLIPTHIQPPLTLYASLSNWAKP
ncbi:unnamed protein product, partial [marine sediment metagenome]